MGEGFVGEAELGPARDRAGRWGGDILPTYESFVLGLEEELAKSKQSGDTCQVEGMS